MATRSSQRHHRRDEARRARPAIAAAERRAQVRQRRRNGVLAALGGAAIVVSIAIATSGGGGRATAATGDRVAGAAFSASLFAGIPQHDLVLGRPSAPVRMVEYADLQCPYCDEYAIQALPQLVTDYVRTGEVSMEFRNLSFIGPDSVRAGRAAAGAAEQNRLWNFVDLMYLNQGEENSGYVTDSYLRRLFAAVPGLNVAGAERASRTPAGDAALNAANADAAAHGISSTPSFEIGPADGALRPFVPASLTPAPFVAELDALLESHR